MHLRLGKTRNIVESSIDSALLAVEIYNKPRTSFRREGYVSLMIIAWTKLLHAYFYQQIGDRYYYKGKNGRYEKVDNERKAWELKTCINELKKLLPDAISPATEANLIFFIGLRNKIEHRHVAQNELDSLIFGEYQSFLYNYENILTKFFGEEYAINENLAYSLQFSRMRTKEQEQASKQVLSKQVAEIRKYVEDYRTSISDAVFASQEYSIKLIQIPKISNTNRGDTAIEFVRWEELDQQDRKNYEKLTTIIKDKVVKKEVVNAGRLKASDVIKEVNKRITAPINFHDHMCIYYVFSVRPISPENKDKFDTNTNYCHYDEPHDDYVYQDSWVNFIVKLFTDKKITKTQIRQNFKKRLKKDIKEYV